MAGEAAESGLRFFLDRGLGSLVVPGALRQAGWVLETMTNATVPETVEDVLSELERAALVQSVAAPRLG